MAPARRRRYLNKAERTALLTQWHDQGLDIDEIARRFRADADAGGLESYRLANNLSQLAVALLYNPDQGSATAQVVSRWEHWPNGHNPIQPSLLVLQRLATIYHTTRANLVAAIDERRPGHEAGVSAQPFDVAQVDGQPSVTEPRLALDDSEPYGKPPDRFGFGRGEIVPDVESWELLQALQRSTIGAGTLDQLEATVAGLAASYPHTPPIGLRDPVLGHLEKVCDLLNGPLPIGHRKRLVIVIGQLGGVAGNLCFDLKAYRKARSYSEGAATAANEADDADLHAWVLANQSLIPTYNGNHYDALRLLRQAQQISGGHIAPSRQAWLDALEARAHAGLGDEQQCRILLRRAHQAMARAEHTSRRPGIDFFDTPRLMGFEGACWLLLQRPEQARRLLLDVLVARDPADVKGRSLVQLDLALTHVQERDIQGACHVVQQALSVAHDSLVEPIMRRVEAVRAELEPWRDTTEVRELDEQLGLAT